MKYAVSESGSIVSIDQVKRGLQCNCKCPYCNSVLVARKGDINSHTFAHYHSDECAGYYETMIHLLAKKALEEAKEIALPPLIGRNLKSRTNEIIKPQKKIRFTSVDSEKRLGCIVPDLRCEIDKEGFKKHLIIEIYVTHKASEEKVAIIQKMNTAAVEIDLSAIDRNIDYDHLKNLIIDQYDNKSWLYNPLLNNYNQRQRESVSTLATKRTCPLNAPTLKGKVKSKMGDCASCIYSVIGYNTHRPECAGYHSVLRYLTANPEIADKEVFSNFLDTILLSRQCPRCGSKMILKQASHGVFWGCTNFRNCKCDTYDTWEYCHDCFSNLAIRESIYGKFLGCTDFPSCKYRRKL